MKEIYIELTSKLRDKLDSGSFSFPGIDMRRKKGSKGCVLEFEDDQYDGVIEMIETLGLAWQDNENGEEIIY